MKLILLIALSLSSLAHAGFSHYDLKMTCGELVKAGNGKILKRLQPSLFGINSKYILRTKFIAPVVINEIVSKGERPADIRMTSDSEVAYTAFSNFYKFDERKQILKKALKISRKAKLPLYACAGHVDVFPFKYSGSEVTVSAESLDAAIEAMRKIARRHL